MSQIQYSTPAMRQCSRNAWVWSQLRFFQYVQWIGQCRWIGMILTQNRALQLSWKKNWSSKAMRQHDRTYMLLCHTFLLLVCCTNMLIQTWATQLPSDDCALGLKFIQSTLNHIIDRCRFACIKAQVCLFLSCHVAAHSHLTLPLVSLSHLFTPLN